MTEKVTNEDSINYPAGNRGPISEKEHRPGSALLAWLTHTADQRGMTPKELAHELGVTYGYIAQLENGIRETRHISDEVVSSIARFLQVPRFVIMFAAGKLRMSDFSDPADYAEL